MPRSGRKSVDADVGIFWACNSATVFGAGLQLARDFDMKNAFFNDMQGWSI
jgi:hypothetical protein